MHIYSRDEIDELSKDLLPSIVLQQSNEIIILQSSLKNIEKHLNHLYKELDGKCRYRCFLQKILGAQKMIFGRSSEKNNEVSSLFDEEQPEEDQQSQTTKPSSNKKKVAVNLKEKIRRQGG